MLRQKRGNSLDLTLQESTELRNLGLQFQKWNVTSPITSTKSTKSKKIVLKRVDKDSDISKSDAFDAQKLVNPSVKERAETELARSIMRKKMQQ